MLTSRRLARATASLAVLLVALTGCSQGSDGPSDDSSVPRVATLTSEPAGSTGTPADPDAGRPRERIDMTDDELERLNAPYQDCMNNLSGGDAAAEKAKQVADAGGGACEKFSPLPPWEVDAANPDAIEFGRAVVACLRSKGVKYVDLEIGDATVMPSLGGDQNDEESVVKGMELLPQCQREVANQ